MVEASAKSGPGRPAGIDSVDTRQRVIDAACRCFAQYGYGPTTNNQIAKMARVTAGAVYYHFGTKSQLFAAALDYAYDKIVARTARATAGQHSVPGLLHAWLTESMRINHESPELAGFVAGAAIDVRRHPELADAYAKDRVAMGGAVIEAVARGQDGGLIPADLDPVQVSQLIGAITGGFALMAAATTPAAMDQLTVLFDMLLLHAGDETPAAVTE